MKPLRLSASNYRSFPSLDLDLPEGVCAIVGHNGAGKSSIVNVIDLCLFGPESRSLEHYLSDDAEGGDLEITLEFEHAGAAYRVRRGYRSRGRGSSSLDFERADEEGDPYPWVPLTRETTAATQAVIEQTIGLSRQTFRASAFLAQGDGAAFTEAAPKDRKAILAEVLSLDIWERLLERARADHLAAQQELRGAQGEALTYEATVADKPRVEQLHAACGDVEKNATQDLAEADTLFEQAQARLREAEQHADKRRVAQAELARAQADHDRLLQIKTAADAAAAEREEVGRALAALTSAADLSRLDQDEDIAGKKLAAFREAQAAHEAARREHDLHLAQQAAIVGQANDHRAKAALLRAEAVSLEAVGPGHSSCERCEQTLGAEALASSLANMRVEADELEATAVDLDAQAAGIDLPVVPAAPASDVEALDRELAHVRSQLSKARDDQAMRARLEERMRSLDETARALGPELDSYIAEAAHKLEAVQGVLNRLGVAGDTTQLAADAEIARRHVLQERERLQTALTEKAKAETLLAQIADAETKLADARKRAAELQDEIDLCADLEKAYGRDGIPALIVESQAVPHIETEANRILAELGTPYRVELHTQRALKSGDGLRDTLDVIVVADAGARPYETFSGGERTRINLALRIALARLLANRRGAESRLLCIDEPEFLDEDGVARLADVLRGLSADFDNVYLISHVPSLRDSFDTTLEVVKDDGNSTVRLAA